MSETRTVRLVIDLPVVVPVSADLTLEGDTLSTIAGSLAAALDRPGLHYREGGVFGLDEAADLTVYTREAFLLDAAEGVLPPSGTGYPSADEYVVVMSSFEYGDEPFHYGTREEAEAGWRRLADSIQKANDGVTRRLCLIRADAWLKLNQDDILNVAEEWGEFPDKDTVNA